MDLAVIGLILLGALAGGFVNGLTGFGTGLTAMGLWLYAVPPATAVPLVIICSVVAQLQTLPMIWRSLAWRSVLPFVVPGLLGVPVGAWLLASIDPDAFKAGTGAFLIAYAIYALSRRPRAIREASAHPGDAAAGFAGGVLGGLAGFSGAALVVWTDLRGWSKDARRAAMQAFNLSILGAAFFAHAVAGLLTREAVLAVAAALPGTIAGSLAGAALYRRLGDRGFERAVLVILIASGGMLLWSGR